MAKIEGDFVLPRCHYSRLAAVNTSWTDRNPGKRFAGCPDYQDEGCNFFKWIDPKMCPRAVEVIPGFLRWIREMEVEIGLCAERVKKSEEKAEVLRAKKKKLVCENVRLKFRYRFLFMLIGFLSLMYLSILISRFGRIEDDVPRHKPLSHGRM